HRHGAADSGWSGQGRQLCDFGIFGAGCGLWHRLVPVARWSRYGRWIGGRRGGPAGGLGRHDGAVAAQWWGRGMSAPLRILLIATGLELGGAERQVVDLADRLATRGHRVGLAYLVGEAELRPGADVELHALDFSKTPAGMLRGCLRLRRLLRQWRPGVVRRPMVHAHLIA